MTYKILQIEQNEETIITKVEYDFDGELVEATIPHFAPKSFKDIEVGIFNRSLSVKNKSESITVSTSLMGELNAKMFSIEAIEILHKNTDQETDTSELSSFSNEDLRNQLDVLSLEFDRIKQMSDKNATQYDLVISELTNRVK